MSSELEQYLNDELNNGIRMTWNVLPHSNTDAQKLVVPIAAFFTPLKVTFFLTYNFCSFTTLVTCTYCGE